MTEETEPHDEAAPQPAVPAQPPAHNRFRLFMISFLVTTIICGYGWYKAEARFSQLQTAKNYEVSFGMEGDVYTRRWKKTGNKSVVLLDMNRDNNYEKGSVYNFTEDLIYETFDDDEDGYDERTIQYAPSGEMTGEFYDLDGDGCHELSINYESGLTVKYMDVDFNCEYDSIYVYSGESRINALSATELHDFLQNPQAKDAQPQ